MTICIRYAAIGSAFIIGLWSAGASAATLIADEEAKRPNPPQSIKVRGISRGPAVLFEEPSGVVLEHAPFEFKVKLETHGGATIAPGNVRVTYLKAPSIDLTERLRPFITAQGIDMPTAQVPAGEHVLRVDVEDSEGHTSQAVITLTAAKQTR